MNVPNEAIIIGGSAKSKEWVQIVADVLNITLIKKDYNDSSFGSAMLAGVVIGYFKDLSDAIIKCSKTVSITKPIKDNVKQYQEIFIRYKKAQKVLEDI